MATRIVGISGSMVVALDLRNLSQTGHFLCNYHNEDGMFEILHAEYVTIKHVKSGLHCISIGTKDGKGCDSCK